MAARKRCFMRFTATYRLSGASCACFLKTGEKGGSNIENICAPISTRSNDISASRIGDRAIEGKSAYRIIIGRKDIEKAMAWHGAITQRGRGCVIFCCSRRHSWCCVIASVVCMQTLELRAFCLHRAGSRVAVSTLFRLRCLVHVALFSLRGRAPCLLSPA